MKDISEQLREMLFRELWDAFKNGQKVSPFDVSNSEYWMPYYDLSAAPGITDEITALINDNYVPKDEAYKCHSCGEPISRECERCKHLWQT